MLKIAELSAGYHKVMIIRDVDIIVQKGEIVGIIGRNGVGKSTFMKAVMGLTKSRGLIEFDRQDIRTKKAYERARLGIGYVQQGHGIFPNLSVAENLKMGNLINYRIRKTNEELVYSYFPRLKERYFQKAGTLSGGEQAMLAIGRVLVGNPKLLLLDEPSEGVQPNIVEQMGEIILQINKELGLTVLFVEQNIRMIQQIATRCYAMDKGTIVGELQQEQILEYEQVKQYLAV